MVIVAAAFSKSSGKQYGGQNIDGTLIQTAEMTKMK